MRKWIKALACGLVLTLLLSLCGFPWGFAEDCGEIRQKVVRLHVLANSDSEEDQALKLRVRDTVTETAAGLFDTRARRWRLRKTSFRLSWRRLSSGCMTKAMTIR